jgi:hypothetical protein
MKMEGAVELAGRLAAAIVLIGMLLFCGFGFLASFEHPGITVWHIVYASSGILLATLTYFDLRPLARIRSFRSTGA